MKACDDIGMSLPDIGTLKSIYNKKSEYPDLPQSDWFWSSSKSNTGGAYDVDFNNGRRGDGNKGSRGGALCVGD